MLTPVTSYLSSYSWTCVLLLAGELLELTVQAGRSRCRSRSVRRIRRDLLDGDAAVAKSGLVLK